MTRKWKKLVAVVMTAAVVVTSVNLSDVGQSNVLAEDVVLYQSAVDTPVSVVTGATFDASSDWSELASEVNVPDWTATTTAPNPGATFSTDIMIKSDVAPSFTGSIKVSGVMRLGSNWFWVQSNSIPEVSAASMTLVNIGGVNYYKASISIPFGDTVGANFPTAWNSSAVFADVLASDAAKGDAASAVVSAFSLKFAGYQCTYAGDIYIANTKLVDGSTSAPLPEADPSVLGSFDSGIDGWTVDGGYQYTHGGAIDRGPVIAWDTATQSMKVSLDYSANADKSWSEAKFKGTFSAPVSVTAYNQLICKITYPEAFTGFEVKAYTKSGETEIINASASPKDVIDNGDGTKTGTIKIGFTPSELTISDLTLGIVGKNTSFTGDVYIDDIMVKQAAAEGAVDITSTPTNTPARADISDMPTSVELVNDQATTETKALAAYLKSLMANDQVLFGHQNDVSKAVYGGATDGDVKSVTGSCAGLMGLDTLALTGEELGLDDESRDALIAECARISKQAADGGAIVTLSAHMPNFSSDTITKNADKSYNFHNCGFMESKDLSGNCAERILPGGDLNEVYNDYLDIIADYALTLQAENIPVLFRPLHENNGGWFWWGSTTSASTYKAIYRYMVDYLTDKGVNNFLYVYSPNGPFSSTTKYMERYPGSEYIDIVAFDYYDDYSSYPAEYSNAYLNNLRTTCEVVAQVAQAENKIPAISETGSRVAREDGNSEGLALTGNPMCGQDWYNKVAQVATETGMPYYLVWANFGSNNFYVPFKYTNTTGHEMINEFIDFYNNPSTIFADGTNFYGTASTTSVNAVSATKGAKGYMITPVDRQTILSATTFTGSVRNAGKVEFVISNLAEADITLSATKGAGSIYTAAMTQEIIASITPTDQAVITLLADGRVLGSASFVSIGKEKNKPSVDVMDDFEYYYGDDALSSYTYGEANAAGGCDATMTLSDMKAKNGSYAGAFNYTLDYKGSEVWAGFGSGKIFENVDFSAYNGISLWVEPDGYGQKFVVQLATGQGEYEAFLTDFVKGTEGKYVTIPFTSFKGKSSDEKLNPNNISALRFFCNSIPANIEGKENGRALTVNGSSFKLSSTLYLDDIRAVKLSSEELAAIPEGSYGVTDTQPGVVKSEPTPAPMPNPTPTPTPAPTPAPTPTPVTTLPGTGDTTPIALYVLIGIAAMLILSETTRRKIRR